MKTILSLLLVLNIWGCSNLSKNTIESGTFYLSNGTFADKVWKENLLFDRYSWYHELTLQFELMMTSIPPQSGFNFWLSTEEMKALNGCKDARIAFAYSNDTNNIPYSALYDQLEKMGFNRIDLPEFKRQLFQHPDASLNSLRLYHVLGLCRNASNTNQILISFPGYEQKSLK